MVPSLKITLQIFPEILLNQYLHILISPQNNVIMLLICIIENCQYLQKDKRYSKKENAIDLYIEKPFK